MNISHYSRSVIMVIMGGVFLSLLGIADRSMDAASGPQIAFYRAVSQSIFFAFVFLILRKTSIRNEFKSLTWRGWLAAALMALAGFFLIMSFQFTLIANAIFFISLTPLFAACLAWVFLKEKINHRTSIAMVIALIGVMIIFGTNINGEGALGMALACTMAVCYAASIVTIRTIPGANIILICTLNAVLTMILMLPLIGDFSLSHKDLIICLGLGVVQVGLGTVFVMSGARYVPAAQVSILALLEVVLSPLWVWIFAGEVPSVTTLIGGAVVLMGVTYQALGARQGAGKASS
jgi:drug/metabolite transporter (DMT)-like permease